MGAWVYMLQCRDGSYYVGSTRQSVEYRLSQHNSGLIEGYTRSRLPVRLVFSEYFDRVTDAVSAERRIKGWSRFKKQALIAGDWNQMKALSRRGIRPASFETPPDGGSSGRGPSDPGRAPRPEEAASASPKQPPDSGSSGRGPSDPGRAPRPEEGAPATVSKGEGR